jgi:transcription factor C subunit 6
VWGLDWCPFPDAASSSHYEQFVAISTIPGMTPVTGARCDRRTRAAIQVWAVPPAGLARCELVLCVEGGPVSDLKWMPMGAWDASSERGLPKLGILAAVHLDGSTALYAVPQPAALRVATPTVASASDPIFLRAAPLARFAVDDAACTCIEWLSGRRLAAGLANGHLVVWDAVSALLGNNDDGGDPLPDMYLTLALSSIRSIAAGRCPPTDAHGALDYAGESVYLAFGSYDGTAGVVDLREPGTVLELNRSRCEFHGKEGQS